ncbi:MAG: hypothetical protein RJA23_884 [Bacteroidota bacterium]|jgi:hypothetical protein
MREIEIRGTHRGGQANYDILSMTNIERRVKNEEVETLKNASTRISSQAEFSLISWFSALAS